ncbi:MAG: YceI family protein [Cyclobacteriaceae bacterium]|nr:YceI family protein [Cyclobacteriaceae bacterium]MCH8515340.1 YceI family protein [Cyclobacteriaceae bacterium]
MRSLIVIFAVLLIFDISLKAQEYYSESAKVRFISKAPMNEFDGVSEHLTGLIQIKKNDLDFYLDLNTLKTGIRLRDKHMRDNYLHTKEHRFADFKGKIKKLSEFSESQLKEGVKVVAVGEFKIHGVSKERSIEGNLKLSPNGEELHLKASFIVLLKDHKIKKPSVMGYDLADEQEVELEGVFKLRK